MKANSKLNPEWEKRSKELREQTNELINNIGHEFRTSPEKIAEYLDFSSRFYNYSINNQKLIYGQNRNATFVQSFNQWKKMGYSINKGEHGLKVFVPTKITYIENDGEYIQFSKASKELQQKYDAGKLNGKIETRFKIGNVFDISQTNFPKEEYPKLFSMGYSSEIHEKICQGLEQFVKDKYDVSVKYDNLDSISLRGLYSPLRNQIKINHLLNDTQKLSTLSHEIGHVIEQHGKRDISGAQKEFEADAISILIQSNFHIELTDSRKEHLASNYREFEAELKDKNPDITAEEIQKHLDEALSNTMDDFMKVINDIDNCVEQYIPREELMQNSIKTTQDKALSKESYLDKALKNRADEYNINDLKSKAKENTNELEM